MRGETLLLQRFILALAPIHDREGGAKSQRRLVCYWQGSPSYVGPRVREQELWKSERIELINKQIRSSPICRRANNVIICPIPVQ